jgi:hypothetical protein
MVRGCLNQAPMHGKSPTWVFERLKLGQGVPLLFVDRAIIGFAKCKTDTRDTTLSLANVTQMTAWPPRYPY